MFATEILIHPPLFKEGGCEDGSGDGHDSLLKGRGGFVSVKLGL